MTFRAMLDLGIVSNKPRFGEDLFGEKDAATQDLVERNCLHGTGIFADIYHTYAKCRQIFQSHEASGIDSSEKI